MRTRKVAGLVLLIVSLAGVGVLQAREKEKGESGRLLTGRIMDKQGNSLTDAVVYLANTRTRAVKTYIVGPNGAYRFPELSLNIDYEVYAQYKGHKSDTKTVSQFDTRSQVNIDLRIDMK
ncbi:MAG TPA: carboxypeptidase-like regulatory domain-containing protein [Terriglobales bacterium]|nr:carboxypeptidase-like regulatory domain-containing protein [Terriglobales bacterium]